MMNLFITLFSITSAFRPSYTNIRSMTKPIYSTKNSLGTMSYSNKFRKSRKIKEKSDKKLITISPGGLQAFYMIGTCKYIKDNYKLNNSYIYSGASAGAWNSLFMTFKGDNDHFVKNILDIDYKNIKSILEIETNIKNKLLQDYTTTDFELNNLYIPVSIIKYTGFFPKIYNNFSSLEDAIECCIASSHIPFVTGGLFKKYNNIISFDGGIISEPYPKEYETILNINPEVWYKRGKNINYFDINNVDIYELFNEGYNDASENSNYLDDIFNHNF